LFVLCACAARGLFNVREIHLSAQESNMNCFFIIGTHFFTWGSSATAKPVRCGRCGAVANFPLKKGMSFITLFFVIPVIPISGVKNIVQCPNCRARYQATPSMLEPQTGGPQFR
jgi:hypothetical protein